MTSFIIPEVDLNEDSLPELALSFSVTGVLGKNNYFSNLNSNLSDVCIRSEKFTVSS